MAGLKWHELWNSVEQQNVIAYVDKKLARFLELVRKRVLDKWEQSMKGVTDGTVGGEEWHCRPTSQTSSPRRSVDLEAGRGPLHCSCCQKGCSPKDGGAEGQAVGRCC